MRTNPIRTQNSKFKILNSKFDFPSKVEESKVEGIKWANWLILRLELCQQNRQTCRLLTGGF
jgi:hypothetical protein